jgi:tRNA(Ile)-lysidine synthase
MSKKNSSYWHVYTLFKEQIQAFFIKNKERKMRLGIACSGGPDSVLTVLLIADYKKEFPQQIEALFIIHIIDGLELVLPEIKEFIDQALHLTEKLSSKTKIPLKIIRNTELSTFKQEGSFEESCHKIRKRIFKETMQKLSLDRLLTGHNKDDQVEHFFIGIIRRSSMRRISGMQTDSGKYLRPLLTSSKEEIVEALREQEQPVLIDPCNTSVIPLRNALRSRIIPLLQELDRRTSESIVALCREIKEYEEHINDEIKITLEDPRIKKISFLKEKKTFFKNKIIEKYCYKKNQGKKEISRNTTDEIIRFLEKSNKKKHLVNTNYLITKHKGEWEIDFIP